MSIEKAGEYYKIILRCMLELEKRKLKKLFIKQRLTK